jgi:hypothetical protein
MVERVNHNTDFYHVVYLSALGNSMADAYYVDLNTGIQAQWNPQKNILLGISYILLEISMLYKCFKSRFIYSFNINDVQKSIF